MHLRIGSVSRRANQLSAPPANSSLDLNITGVRTRDGVSITAPVFILTKNVGDLETYNYLYCVTWSRYYFIIDIDFDGELQYVYCTEDVLGTWNSTIRSQSFYCLRSTVGYDDTIADTQFPMICGATNKDMDTENPWADTVNTGNGFYVTGIISENAGSTFGSVSYIVSHNLDLLVEGLLESCYEEVSSNIQAKAYADPMSNIVSCIYIPTNLDISAGMAPAPLKIGLWDCPLISGTYGLLNGTNIIGGMVGVKTIDLPAPDPPTGADRYYKHFPPYTTLSLYAPPFGDVDLPEECYRWCLPTTYAGGYGGLRATIYVDVRTGYGMMAVSPMGKTPQNYCAFVGGGQVGVDVGLSGVSQSGAWRYNADKFTGRMATFTSGVTTVTGAVSDISGTVGSFATGRIAKGVSDVANTVGDIQSGINDTISSGVNTAMQNYENLIPSVSSVSGNGDFSGLMVEQPWSIRLVFINNKIDNTNCGEPHMSDCTPESVSGGFAIFQNAAVTGDMLLGEKNMINQFLTTGVYIS